MPIHHSSEFITNFRQIKVFAESAELFALQNSNGNTVLFSRGSDNKLYLTLEQADSDAGWRLHDVTPHQDGEVSALTAVQSKAGGPIQVYAAVKNGGKEILYHAAALNADQLGGAKEPQIDWKEIPDDRPAGSPALAINDIYVLPLSNTGSSEASDSGSVVVDTTEGNVIHRYYLKTEATDSGKVWNSHMLPADIDHGKVVSILGRSRHQEVDGVYTFGAHTDETVLEYAPLYNVEAPGTAAPAIVLKLPEGIQFANSMVAVGPRDSSFGATDLFLAGNGKLYYLPVKDQQSKKSGEESRFKVVASSPFFKGMKHLSVTTETRNQTTKIYVWGLDGTGQLFYSSCEESQLGQENVWTKPIPFLSSVKYLSPYSKVEDGSLTFFAVHGASSADKKDLKLSKAYRSPIDRTWRYQKVTLPQPKDKAVKSLSYTTHLTITDENNFPVDEGEVTIKSEDRIDLSVNNVYCVAHPEGVKVKTDKVGGLSIVEWVDDVKGSILTIEYGGDSTDVNPMLANLEKLKQLQSKDDIKNTVTTLPDGTQSRLVPQDTSQEKLDQLHEALGNLKSAWEDIQNPNSEHSKALKAAAGSVEGVASDVAGEVFGWIEHTTGININVPVIEKIAGDIWHFSVKIADEVISFALATARQVIKAVEAVWKAIVDAVQGLWDFLKFLFDIDDFIRTRDVTEKIIDFYFDRIADWFTEQAIEIKEAKETIDIKIEAWATDRKTNFPTDKSGQLSRSTKTSTKGHDNTTAKPAPTAMFSHHFKNNAQRGHYQDQNGTPPTIADGAKFPVELNEDLKKQLQPLINTIKTTIDDELENIKALERHLKQLFVSVSGGTDAKISTTDLEAAAKGILADIAKMAVDLFMGLAKVVMEFLALLVEAIKSALHIPIYIPILSECLEHFFHRELPSMLDIMLLVGTAPGTLLYKGIYQEAPFPADDPVTKAILESTDYKTFKENIKTVTAAGNHWINKDLELTDAGRAKVNGISKLQAGITGELKTVLEVVKEETEGGAPFIGGVLTMLNFTGQATSIFDELFADLAPTADGDNESMADKIGEVINDLGSWINRINIIQELGFSVLPSILFGPATGEGGEAVNPLERVAGAVSVALGLASLVPTIYDMIDSVVEQAKEGVDDVNDMVTTSAGILDGVSSILGVAGGTVGFAGEYDPEGISKEVLIAVALSLNLYSVNLQLAEGVILLGDPT